MGRDLSRQAGTRMTFGFYAVVGCARGMLHVLADVLCALKTPRGPVFQRPVAGGLTPLRGMV